VRHFGTSAYLSAVLLSKKTSMLAHERNHVRDGTTHEAHDACCLRCHQHLWPRL
jgi:hypothetical protein